jgi:uncharacterized protein
MSSPAAQLPPAPTGFHLMAKPMGALCNLDCQYCFYLEKEKLYPPNENFRMTDAVLENYVQQYIATQDGPEITFAWQGGEPTLLGVEFYRKAISWQKQFAGDKQISNTLQTNGTLLDDAWCDFLAANKFLVGVSIDGPRELHDAYRVDKKQQPTFDSAMRGIELLKKHGVEFNTLTVVNRKNSKHPLEVYRFLKQIGSRYLQFIPLVERQPNKAARALGLDFATPPSPDEIGTDSDALVTEASVEARQYGEFLIAIFEDWILRDVGRIFVQLFDVALSNWMGLGSSMCVFAERCGAAMALEHNGDVFSCDHYVYPNFKLGNLMHQSLGDMARSPAQKKFGTDKFDSLPKYCRACEVRFACNGECPKHRFIQTPDGEAGLNYLCAGYKKFFNHIEPYMVAMGQLIQAGKPAALIMEVIAEHERSEVWRNLGRNDPCPCGSGRKYKHCCLERRTHQSHTAST